MAVLGQFWYVTEGAAENTAPHGDDFSDARLVYINDDGTNQNALANATASWNTAVNGYHP